MALKGINKKLIYCTSEEVQLGTVVRKKTNLESDIQFSLTVVPIRVVRVMWTKNDPQMEKGRRKIGVDVLGSRRFNWITQQLY